MNKKKYSIKVAFKYILFNIYIHTYITDCRKEVNKVLNEILNFLWILYRLFYKLNESERHLRMLPKCFFFLTSLCFLFFYLTSTIICILVFIAGSFIKILYMSFTEYSFYFFCPPPSFFCKEKCSFRIILKTKDTFTPFK